MKNELKDALTKAIQKVLPILHELSSRFVEQRLVWSKVGNGWHGQYEQRPCGHEIYAAASSVLAKESVGLNALFKAAYPAHFDGFACCAGASMELAKNAKLILTQALSLLQSRYGSYDCPDWQIAVIVDECLDFFESPTTPVRYQATLLNFKMDADTLPLSDDLIIRRLTEKEVSDIYGGSIESMSFGKPSHLGMSEFVIERLFQEAIQIQASVRSNDTREMFTDKVSKAILALRTFKSGPVGCGEISAHFIKFSLFNSGATTFQLEHIPFGTYQLSSSELSTFDAHAKLITTLTEPTMETACFQLAAAATRLRHQDRLLDSVIGMEALLLPVGGKGELKYKGESRYRFSLNYSTLFPSPQERHAAFREARDLYDHRSAIAHGGGMNDELFKVGTKKMSLAEVASYTSETLRKLIARLLPDSKMASYKKNEFWERAYFGLDCEDVSASQHHQNTLNGLTTGGRD